MAFELSPFGTGEHELFYRLPCEDRYLGYGVMGRLRGEVDFSGDYDTWLPQAPQLITPAFREEIKALREALRMEIFHGGNASLEFCRTAQAIDKRDTGFRISTDNYTYYSCCQPGGPLHYELTMFAYDNSFLLPELAGLHKLPDHCFSVQPDSGELIILQQERPYIQSFHSDDPVEVRRRIADDLNGAMGVTKAQEAAMLAGCLHGFDQPCAWPWQYDQSGEPRKYVIHQKEKEAR